MLGKIQLFTCMNGVELFEDGSTFDAWEEGSRSYKLLVGVDDANIKIIVDENDIKETSISGKFNIIDVKSVKILKE